MNTHADKTQENKSLSVANSIARRHAFGDSTFQFEDNRPEAIVQRKLQEMVNKSPQVKQIAQIQAIVGNYSGIRQKPIQRVPKRAEIIWATTHLVKKMNGSLFGGEDFVEGEIGPEGELSLGQRIIIDDEKTFLSRRTSNQENAKIRSRDKASKPSVVWYHVLMLNDKDVRAQKLYVRQNVFSLSPSQVGKKEMSVDALSLLGISNIATLRQWFNGKRNELNVEANRYYEAVYQKTKTMMEGFGASFGPENKTPANRKGWCGQTSNAILRYLSSRYPAIHKLGKIVKGTDPKGGTHEYLIFEYDGGHVLVDPTYKQFDTGNKLAEEHDILVATKGTHPNQEFTRAITPAVVDLEMV